MTELYKDTILDAKEADDVVSLLRAKESMTLIWLPGSGRTHLGHTFQNEKFFNKLMTKKELEGLVVVYVDQDINIKYLDTHILGNLSQYGNFTLVNEGLFNLVNKGHHIVFVIDNFHLDKGFFDYMNSLRSVSVDNISFIFMVLQSEYDNLVQNYPNASSLIYHNVVKIAYFTDEQSKEWIKHTAESLNVKLTESRVEAIVDFSGGIPLLIKNYIRLSKKYPSHQKILKSQEMRVLLLKLLGMFSKPARKVLELLASGSNPGTADERYIIKYLTELGLLTKQNEIRGKWVNEIFEQKDKSQLIVEGNRIYIQDIDHTFKFTKKEFAFIKKIVKSKKVSRDELANIIFSSVAEHSDWAMDKFISRTRKKLRKLGLTKNAIKTVRGYGYKLA